MNTDGTFPAEVLTSARGRPIGIYVHIPWCASRCGYCDFNTYVPGTIDGVGPVEFVDDVVREIEIAAQQFEGDAPAVRTVFFGGGTPTLLPVADLVRILGAIRSWFGLRPDAEVTTECNPESVDEDYLVALRSAGFNRVSIGMQSAVSSVLRTLDRQHSPGRAVEVAQLARQAGFEQVSLDLIYGTPGETDADWEASLNAVVSADPTHVSAYSLIVEDGTAMARRVRLGELPAPDEDVLARRYEIAERVLGVAGFKWYEVSNWARDDDSRCHHNLGYWRGIDWLGFGPGAHSHVRGTRWWNIKHPARYGTMVEAGELPIQAWECLSDVERETERIMLEVRISDGLDVRGLTNRQYQRALEMVGAGLCDSPDESGRLKLTFKGRLLADHVVRELLG